MKEEARRRNEGRRGNKKPTRTQKRKAETYNLKRIAGLVYVGPREGEANGESFDE